MIARDATRLILALAILASSATAGDFPFAKGTFDADGKLKQWKLEDVRIHCDKAIGDLAGRNSVVEKDDAADPLLEPVRPTVDPRPWERGCQFAVNTISEDPSTNFSNGQMGYAIAHEIGHTLIWARHSGHPGSYPGLMANDFPPGTIVTSLSQFQIHSDVVSLVDLRTRSSVIK